MSASTDRFSLFSSLSLSPGLSPHREGWVPSGAFGGVTPLSYHTSFNFLNHFRDKDRKEIAYDDRWTFTFQRAKRSPDVLVLNEPVGVAFFPSFRLLYSYPKPLPYQARSVATEAIKERFFPYISFPCGTTPNRLSRVSAPISPTRLRKKQGP